MKKNKKEKLLKDLDDSIKKAEQSLGNLKKERDKLKPPKEYKKGKWYLSGYGELFICHSKGHHNQLFGKGFTIDKLWADFIHTPWIGPYTEAPEALVREALIREAKKRGFDYHKYRFNGSVLTGEIRPKIFQLLFENGNWISKSKGQGTLEDGWYKSDKSDGWLGYIKNGNIRYGIFYKSAPGKYGWFESNIEPDKDVVYSKASQTEIENALISEAKKRGFDFHNYRFNGSVLTGEIHLKQSQILFQDGEWIEKKYKFKGHEVISKGGKVIIGCKCLDQFQIIQTLKMLKDQNVKTVEHPELGTIHLPELKELFYYLNENRS